MVRDRIADAVKLNRIAEIVMLNGIADVVMLRQAQHDVCFDRLSMTFASTGSA
jgi:hypothetical protein